MPRLISSKQKWCRACRDVHPIGDFWMNRGKPMSICKKARNQALFEKREARRAPRPCIECGTPFKPQHLDTKFCSRRCKAKAGGRRRLGKEYKRTCPNCSTQFTTKQPFQKFCSPTCIGSARSFKRIRNRPQNPLRAARLNTPCLHCGGPCRQFRSKYRSRTAKFCSRRCTVLHRRGVNHPAWRGPKLNDRGANWQDRAKEAIERDGNICQICKSEHVPRPTKAGWSWKRPPVDHVVPYRLARETSKDPNALLNLLTACISCHGKKTPLERLLLKGDVVGFLGGLRILGWPMDRVQIALDFYGL